MATVIQNEFCPRLRAANTPEFSDAADRAMFFCQRLEQRLAIENRGAVDTIRFRVTEDRKNIISNRFSNRSLAQAAIVDSDTALLALNTMSANQLSGVSLMLDQYSQRIMDAIDAAPKGDEDRNVLAQASVSVNTTAAQYWLDRRFAVPLNTSRAALSFDYLTRAVNAILARKGSETVSLALTEMERSSPGEFIVATNAVIRYGQSALLVPGRERDGIGALEAALEAVEHHIDCLPLRNWGLELVKLRAAEKLSEATSDPKMLEQALVQTLKTREPLEVVPNRVIADLLKRGSKTIKLLPKDGSRGARVNGIERTLLPIIGEGIVRLARDPSGSEGTRRIANAFSFLIRRSEAARQQVLQASRTETGSPKQVYDFGHFLIRQLADQSGISENRSEEPVNIQQLITKALGELETALRSSKTQLISNIEKAQLTAYFAVTSAYLRLLSDESEVAKTEYMEARRCFATIVYLRFGRRSLSDDRSNGAGIRTVEASLSGRDVQTINNFARIDGSPEDGLANLLANAPQRAGIVTGQVLAATVVAIRESGMVVATVRNRILVPATKKKQLVPGLFGDNWRAEAGGLGVEFTESFYKEFMGRTFFAAILPRDDSILKRSGCSAIGTCRGEQYVAQVLNEVFGWGVFHDGENQNVWTGGSNAIAVLRLPRALLRGTGISERRRDIARLCGLLKLVVFEKSDEVNESHRVPIEIARFVRAWNGSLSVASIAHGKAIVPGFDRLPNKITLDNMAKRIFEIGIQAPEVVEHQLLT